MKTVQSQLKEAGYDFATAIATQSEIDAGAACGMLSLVVDNQ